MLLSRGKILVTAVLLSLMIGMFAMSCKNEDNGSTTPVLQDHPMTYMIGSDTATVT